MTFETFADMNVSAPILHALETMGIFTPTPVQEQAIPPALEGRDILGQSQTGTGKTLAFGIPMVQRFNPQVSGVQSLILCPTRELAVQVSKELQKLSRSTPIKVVAVYGGESIDRQIKALRSGAGIVVGTPGRILDHIRRRTLWLKNVHTVVLDEADEMLDMGFIEDIESILSQTDEDHQTMLFSATLPPDILKLVHKYLRDPEKILVKTKTVTVDKIDQAFIRVQNQDKAEVLSRIIRMQNAQKVMIFCNTKKTVDELTAEMQNRGHSVEGLHGDMKQQKRDYVMSRFKSSAVKILIATDVAARGLDISNVDIVFNYDIPQDEEQYVHRIGRTGRAGKTGKSYALAYGRDLERLRQIERYAKCQIREEKIPAFHLFQENVMNNYIGSMLQVAEGEDMSLYLDILSNMEEQGVDLKLFLAGVLKASRLIREKDPIDLKSYERKARKERSSLEVRPSRFSGKDKKVPSSSMVQFQLNMGRKQNISVGDIVGAVAGECGINGKSIGYIKLNDNSAIFEVPAKHEKTILKGMHKVKIRGKKVDIEKL